jgi:hypothetical protein
VKKAFTPPLVYSADLPRINLLIAKHFAPWQRHNLNVKEVARNEKQFLLPFRLNSMTDEI